MIKNIWISGSRGFVGARVEKTLRAAGHRVTCLSNSPANGSDVIYTDFSDRNHIKEVVNKYGVPETFIHLGWGNVYQPHDPEHLTDNLSNGINLVNELYDLGVDRFISIGSSSEYGDRVGLLTEDCWPLGTVNNYIKGKTALAKYGLEVAERMARKFIHVRLFYTYGAGQKHNSLINQLFQSYLDQKPIGLSPCDQFRDYIYVSDAAEGILRICNADYSGIINLGSGRVIQLREFVKLIWSELGGAPGLLEFGSHDRPVNEQSQPVAYADLTTLKDLTNWSPSFSIEQGVKETVAELRKLQQANCFESSLRT
jgi:UDP-glucose 4-epimerase